MKEPNYSEAQESRIRQAASEGPLNATVAATLADEFGKTARSVIAKIIRMGLDYDRKVPTTKSGDPVEKKETLVAEIGAVVSGNLDGLEKAPKAALRAVRDFVKANA